MSSIEGKELKKEAAKKRGNCWWKQMLHAMGTLWFFKCIPNRFAIVCFYQALYQVPLVNDFTDFVLCLVLHEKPFGKWQKRELRCTK